MSEPAARAAPRARSRTRTKPLLKLGRRGRWVRIVVRRRRGVPMYVCEFKALNGEGVLVPASRWYPRTPEGLARAEGFATERAQQQDAPAVVVRPRVTTRQIWELYTEANFPHMRPNTKRNATQEWTVWMEFVGPHTIAEDLGPQSMAALRAELDRRETRSGAIGWSPNTQSRLYQRVRTVYNWAETYDLITKNRVGRYRYLVAKEDRRESPPEYRLEEYLQLLAAFDLRRATEWRAGVALGICGAQGKRQHQVLHLQWADCDHAAGEIIWRAAWDKNGLEERQPMRAITRRLLEAAAVWRDRLARPGTEPSPWVFPSHHARNRSPCYTIQSLFDALSGAEARAGIPHLKGRGGHGLRRLLAGEAHEMTGSIKDAMDAIGDKDIRMAQRYLKRRDDRMVTLFERLDERLEELIAQGRALADGADGTAEP